MRYRWFGCLAVAAVLVAGCGDDAPTAGPVTIETQITFSGEFPTGTFEVTEGADVLGCSAGTFVDADAIVVDDRLDVSKVMTCDSGDKGGTFTALFSPDERTPGPGEQNGPWTIIEATEDFVGLDGGGDFSVVFETQTTAVETLTGDIEFTS